MDLPSLAAFLSPKDEAPPLEPQPLERRHALIWDSLGPLPGHLWIIEMIQNIRLLDSRNIILLAEFGIRICNQLSRRLL
jgi:hypothetical protein